MGFEGGRCKEPSRRGNVGYMLVKSDRRETAAVLENIRFITDWNNVRYNVGGEKNANNIIGG